MRSGITRRWLRGNLLITVLLVLLAEAMFLYSYTRSYYNSVQQTMYRRFSSVSGQLKMYTGDTVQSTAATRSVALRRMVEQFADKDKYEFMLLFNSYLSIFTGAILHAPVIPVRIIPLQHPTVQENKFTRLKEFFCAISTNAFWARQFLFSKHHNFSYICNLPTKAKKLCHFSLKKITKCCIVRFLQLFYFLYILKNIFRNSSSLFFRIFSLHF